MCFCPKISTHHYINENILVQYSYKPLRHIYVSDGTKKGKQTICSKAFNRKVFECHRY